MSVVNRFIAYLTSEVSIMEGILMVISIFVAAEIMGAGVQTVGSESETRLLIIGLASLTLACSNVFLVPIFYLFNRSKAKI